MFGLFEERPRKVHLYVDRTGQTYNTSGKPREYAHTLCKGNFASPELLTTDDPRKVTCKSCRKKLLDNMLEEKEMSRQDDNWRGIAAEMGYEPKAHLDVRPKGQWILDRIAKFRRMVAREELIKDPTLAHDIDGPVPELPQAPTFLMQIDKGEPHHTIPMVLFCPNGHRHIDEGEFATSPHHTHACQECGIVWRPAKVNTHGVRFLPGYKNGD